MLYGGGSVARTDTAPFFGDIVQDIQRRRETNDLPRDGPCPQREPRDTAQTSIMPDMKPAWLNRAKGSTGRLDRSSSSSSSPTNQVRMRL